MLNDYKFMTKKSISTHYKENIIYKSSNWYFPFTIVLLSNVFVLIFHGFNLTYQLIMVFILIVLFLHLKQFVFYENHFCCVNVFRPSFLLREKCYSYKKIYSVEIRRLKKPYNRPYVIFHFNEKQVESKSLSLNRYFLYSEIKPLDPLLKKLKENNINFKLNISNEFYEDKRFLKQFLS
jgi:hypothetical protein